MRGLLYKEYCVGRKSYFSFLALTLVLMLLGILVCLSMICGNLQEFAKDRQQVEYTAMVFTYLPFAVSLLAINGVDEAIYKDYASKWMYYSYTFPNKALLLVGVRYVCGGIVLAGSCFLGVINVFLVNGLAGITITVDIWKNMGLLLLGAVLLLALQIPMSLKYKTAQAVNNRILLMIAIPFVLLEMKLMGVLGETQADMEQYVRENLELWKLIRDKVLLFAPLAAIFALVLSSVLAIKIYQRREG